MRSMIHLSSLDYFPIVDYGKLKLVIVSHGILRMSEIHVTVIGLLNKHVTVFRSGLFQHIGSLIDIGSLSVLDLFFRNWDCF